MTDHDIVVPSPEPSSLTPATSLELDVPARDAPLLDRNARSALHASARRAPVTFLDELLRHAETHGGIVGTTPVDVGGMRTTLAHIKEGKARGRQLRRELRALTDKVLVAESDLATRAVAALASLEVAARTGTTEQRLAARELRDLQAKPTRSKKVRAKETTPPPDEKK